MEIAFHGRNLELTEAIRHYAEKKLQKLEKYLGSVLVQVALGGAKERHRAEITVAFHGLTLRAEEETGDLYVSIDGAIKVIEEQIRRHRAKIAQRVRHGAGKDMQPFWHQAVPAKKEVPEKVVRQKRFALKLMEVDEAILQLNLLGHDFYVFANAETHRVNVLYRRKGGDYGLLEPEM